MNLLLKDKILSQILSEPGLPEVTLTRWPCDTMLEPGKYAISSLSDWDSLGLPESAREWVWAALQIRIELILEVE